MNNGWNPFDKHRKEQQAKRQEFAERERQKSEARMKERAFAAYITNGGTARGFEDEWPELRREMLKNSVTKGMVE